MIIKDMIFFLLKGKIRMSNSNFICACLPSVIQHFNSLLKYYPTYATHEQINKFLHGSVNKFLSSLGVVMSRGCTINEKLIDKYVIQLNKMIERPYMNNCITLIDSAGYQIQTGWVDRKEIPNFIDLYHDYFLMNQHSKLDKAFCLDIVMGYSHSIFKSWQDIEELNIYSYEKAANLPDEVREKIIYIHHFRTPKIYKIYKKLFRELNLPKKFKHFGTGGLVSMKNTKSPPPCVMYVVPLMDVINHATDNNLKEVSFHALGETEWKSILTHCFLEKHIKKLYNIDLTITYDSSSIFKILGLSRFTYLLDNNSIWKLGLRSETIKNIYKNTGKTNEQQFCSIINEAMAGFGMKPVDPKIDPLYEESGQFSKLYYTYGILHLFHLFKEVQDLCQNIVNDLYPIYQAGEDALFNQQIEKWMLAFNNGLHSRKINTRTNSIWNSLKILENMDLDYSDYLVNHYMASEENQELPDKH